ncbi:regulatory protein repA [Escherichia coli EPECa12]|nr:regulatory protein repA [Escherichia coli EPECa12]
MATHKPINILEAFAAAPPPLDYVLPNMVAGTVGALVSPGGAGKSMLALQLAAQIAGGPDLLEVGELPTGPVIYLPAEDPPTAIHHRLHALGAHLSAEERQAVADGLLIQPLIGSLPNIMAPEWFDGLKRAAEGRRLMVLDTLRRFHIEEENASGPMAQVIGRDGGHRRRYRVLYRVPAPCQQGRGHDGRRRPAAGQPGQLGTGR